MVTSYDVAVAGGGPAGAFAALELTRAGLTTVLIDPGTARPRLEGLGERVAHLLARKGLDDVRATASAPVYRSVSWAGLQDSRNGERLVPRADFDEALRRAAEAAGTTIIRSRVNRYEMGRPDTGVTLKLADGGTAKARLLVDARGRGAHARGRLKGPQTLAIAGLISPNANRNRTHVEATPEGWLWCAEAEGFGRWLQICVDADSLEGAGDGALEGRMRSFLGQSALKTRFADTSFSSDLHARAAGLVLSAPDLSGPVIPIGDAAVALDPLSGHGIFWAISSALSCVPMALTILDDPDQGADLAARIFRARVVQTFWRQARVGRDFYRLENRFAKAPFWARRRGWPDDRTAHPHADAPSLARRVVVENNRLRERDVLITPDHPDGIAFVAGIPVSDLTDLFHADVPGPFQTASTSPALSAAVRWLESQGVINGPSGPTRKTRSSMRETA
ncbi:pilus assembly protein CpaE [Rhodobacterales bacterium]|nr:pilus assembly protein CpaE [Rhodobacterales bacterium]